MFLVLRDLLWVKRKFVHHIGFPRTRTQRSGTQCNGTRARTCVQTFFFEYEYDKSQ
jgi:hypothetical protein